MTPVRPSSLATAIGFVGDSRRGLVPERAGLRSDARVPAWDETLGEQAARELVSALAIARRDGCGRVFSDSLDGGFRSCRKLPSLIVELRPAGETGMRVSIVCADGRLRDNVTLTASNTSRGSSAFAIATK
jgi:hypothetical protein